MCALHHDVVADVDGGHACGCNGLGQRTLHAAMLHGFVREATDVLQVATEQPLAEAGLVRREGVSEATFAHSRTDITFRTLAAEGGGPTETMVTDLTTVAFGNTHYPFGMPQAAAMAAAAQAKKLKYDTLAVDGSKRVLIPVITTLLGSNKTFQDMVKLVARGVQEKTALAWQQKGLSPPERLVSLSWITMSIYRRMAARAVRAIASTLAVFNSRQRAFYRGAGNLALGQALQHEAAVQVVEAGAAALGVAA